LFVVLPDFDATTRASGFTTSRVKILVALLFELTPITTYAIGGCGTVGVPEKAPVFGLKVIPAGASG
jgi:hypothetical protein